MHDPEELSWLEKYMRYGFQTGHYGHLKGAGTVASVRTPQLQFLGVLTRFLDIV